MIRFSSGDSARESHYKVYSIPLENQLLNGRYLREGVAQERALLLATMIHVNVRRHAGVTASPEEAREIAAERFLFVKFYRSPPTVCCGGNSAD